MTDGPEEREPDGTTTVTEDQPPPPRPERPVLRRHATDKVLGGVAGGVARTLSIDPVVVRVITVVLCFAFPPVLVAYLAAWLVVARDGEPARPPTGGIALREAGGAAFWVGVALLAVLLLAALDDPFGRGFDLLPLVLIGIGVALWSRDGERRPPAASPETWPTTTTTGGAMPVTTTTPPHTAGAVPPGGTGDVPAGPGPARPTPPPPPPPPRSPLGGITIGVALIATGVVAALDQVESLPLDADPTHLAAVALLVLGLGQLVGARWGRARWLSLVAIFLIPPVVAGAAFREVDAAWDLDAGDFDVSDGIGEQVVYPFADTPLPEDVRLLAGSVRLDLTEWTPDDTSALEGDEDLLVEVGAGEVIITTPTDVPWRVLGEVRIGEVLVNSATEGTDRVATEDVGESLQVLRTGGPQDGEVLDIVVDIRFGQLTVHANDVRETP